MSDKLKQSLRDTVLATIKERRISMRPRWHFALRTILAILGGLLILGALLYLTSFMFFSLHHTGAWFAPAFGGAGWRLLFLSLPWLLILLSLLFVGLLEVLMRQYPIGYRRPLLYSLLLIILVVAVGGALLARTSFHSNFSRAARENHLPVAGPFYRQFGEHRPPDLHRGVITATTTQGFSLREFSGEEVAVIIDPRTRLPSGADFKPGDSVIVIGPEARGTIQAFGVDPVVGDDQD